MSECNIPLFHSGVYKGMINKAILSQNLQGVQQMKYT